MNDAEASFATRLVRFHCENDVREQLVPTGTSRLCRHALCQALLAVHRLDLLEVLEHQRDNAPRLHVILRVAATSGHSDFVIDKVLDMVSTCQDDSTILVRWDRLDVIRLRPVEGM